MVSLLLEGITFELLLRRGWVTPVAFCSIGIGFVLFAFGQSISAVKEWENLRKKVGNLTRMDRRRYRSIKKYLEFICVVETAGSGYFLALPSLLILYCSAEPSENVSKPLIKFALFAILIPTFLISYKYLSYRIRGHRLH